MVTCFIRTPCRWLSLLKKKSFILLFCLVHLLFVHITPNKFQCIFIYLNWCQQSLPSNRGRLLILFYIRDWAVNFLNICFDYQSRCQQPCDLWFKTIMLIIRSCLFWPLIATACLDFTKAPSWQEQTLLFLHIQLQAAIMGQVQYTHQKE